MNRRHVLQGVQGLGLGLVVTRGYATKYSASVYFTHSVASGDPEADRVILWTRVIPNDGTQSVAVSWQVAEDAGFRRVVALGESTAESERDFTVKVDATGLEPNTRYFYRFLCMGVTSDTGRTKTMPSGDVTSFKIGVASCSNFPQGYFNAYRHMADTNLDLVLHLGDYIYEYPEASYANDYARNVLNRNVAPTHETVALEDYRMRYGLYRTDEDLQAVHQRHPFICVWDDHELANNTWKDGAENHNEGEGDFHARIRAARQAYHEWMPIRTPAEGDQGPIYRGFQIGTLADLIMLDTRLVGRDRGLEYSKDMLFLLRTSPDQAPRPDVEGFKAQRLRDPKRNLLGEKQEQWLDETLTQSAKRGCVWQILGQQVLMGRVGIPNLGTSAAESDELTEAQKQYVQFMQVLGKLGMPLNLDAWDGYPISRERVAAMMVKAGGNPVVLAGDTHNAWAFNLADDDGRPIAVEVGTPGISSPGMESYLQVSGAELTTALKAASSELVDVDTSQRGWSEIELTPSAMSSQWHFVSTIMDRRFTTTSSTPLVCKAGERQFS